MRSLSKAVAEKTDEKKAAEEGEDLAKSYHDVMDGLEAFIKSSSDAKAAKAAEIEAEKKIGEKAALLKSTQEKLSGKDQGEGDDEFAKSLGASGEVEELDGVKVFTALQKSLGQMIAKAIVTIREDLIAHIDQKIAESQDSQLLVAKSLSVHGKLLKEALQEMASIGGQPRGRKSAFTVLEKSMSGGGETGKTEENAALNVERIMHKAVQLNAQGKLQPTDVNVINHYVVAGMPIPQRFAHLFETTQ